jgi:uncharacterized protein (TIGR02453 family)
MNPYITTDLFAFLADLEANNDRDWFQANKKRYEAVYREPLFRFIEDIGPLVAGLSPHYHAIPSDSGGSLFRIYRDTRFSKNKTPYKTWAAIRFRHASGKDGVAPGFYFHIQPGRSMVGMGLWHGDGPALRAIREAMDADPEVWHAARDAVFGGANAGTDSAKFRWGGDSLVRAPKGYDVDHPDIEDLKRKDFVAFRSMTDDEVLAPDVVPHVAQLMERGRPLVKWLAEAVDLPF